MLVQVKLAKQRGELAMIKSNADLLWLKKCAT